MNGRWAYFKWQYPLVRRLMTRAERADEIQRDVMMRMVRASAGSRFGQNHGFASVRSLSDLRRQLPITNFEYFRPYVDEVRAGNSGALFSPETRVRMFALTSGTTEKAKHIPVTDEFVRSYKRGWKIWGLKTHADHMDLLTKDYVHLVSDFGLPTTGQRH